MDEIDDLAFGLKDASNQAIGRRWRLHSAIWVEATIHEEPVFGMLSILDPGGLGPLVGRKDPLGRWGRMTS